jgi:hypothetical protein
MTIKSLASISLLLVLAISCTNNEAQLEKQKLQNDSILQAQEDSLMNAFTIELQGIASVVNEVGTRNGLFDLDTSEGEGLTKDAIIRKVQGLDQLLAENQKRLDQVSKNIRSNKVKNKELESMIQAMQESIAVRETEIKDLMKLLSDKDLQIEEIRTRVDSMRKDNIMLADEMVQMDQEMHSVYYVVGEGKELKEKGLVTKEGGILGVGGTKKLDVSKMDNSLFTSSDQRDLESIALYSEKAKLITNHPEGSYEFLLDEDQNVTSMKIIDRKKFWMAGDYLVIEVSN